MFRVTGRALIKKKETTGQSMSTSVIAEGRAQRKTWQEEGQEWQGEGSSSRRKERSRWQPEDGLWCKQPNWRSLKLEFVIRSPTVIPFIEKQTVKIRPMNVYRPHQDDGVLVVSYFRDRF